MWIRPAGNISLMFKNLKAIDPGWHGIALWQEPLHSSGLLCCVKPPFRDHFVLKDDSKASDIIAPFQSREETAKTEHVALTGVAQLVDVIPQGERW